MVLPIHEAARNSPETGCKTDCQPGFLGVVVRDFLFPPKHAVLFCFRGWRMMYKDENLEWFWASFENFSIARLALESSRNGKIFKNKSPTKNTQVTQHFLKFADGFQVFWKYLLGGGVEYILYFFSTSNRGNITELSWLIFLNWGGKKPPMRFSFVVRVEGFFGGRRDERMSLLRLWRGTSVAFTADAPAEPKVGIKKIKTIQVIQSDLFSGPNWRSLLDSTSFRLTWYRMEKTNWSDCFNLWVRAFIQASQKGSHRIAGDFFPFFLFPHAKDDIFWGEDGRRKKRWKMCHWVYHPKKQK